MTYNNTSGSPNTADRTIALKVFDGAQTSNSATRTVTIAAAPVAPTIASVTAPANGTYAAGQSLTFTVNYSTNVVVTGEPRLSLTIGAASRNATYVSGSNSTALTFSYTVVLADNDADGIAVASPIVLNGGTILGADDLAADLAFVAPDTSAVLVSTAPVLAASGGATAFTSADNAPSTPVVVDSGLTLLDPSLSALPANGAVLVTITGNYQSGTDVLGFTNTSAATFGDLQGMFLSDESFLGAAGTLALFSPGGTATIAQVEAALRVVTFTSTAAFPATADRTISFTVNDGVQSSNTVTKTVTVTAVNQTPIITLSGGATSFFVGGAAVAVDAGLTVTDANDTTLSRAEISVDDFEAGVEAVLFTADGATMGNIAGAYEEIAGVPTLVLTSAGATATLAQWQAALRAVTYLSNANSASTRTVNVTVDDGTTRSAVAMKSVAVSLAPSIDAVAAPANGTYHAGDALNFTVTFSGVVTVTGTPSFAVTIGGATRAATYVSGSGTNELVFRYTIALGDNAAGGIAIASPIALNGGTITGGGAVAAGLTFVPPDTAAVLISTAPELAASGGVSAFTTADNDESDPVLVDAGVTITDPSATTLASGTVAITSGLQAGEDHLLLFASPATIGNITSSYDGATGVLTLTSAGATATVAQWQAALRSIVYYNVSITPNTTNRTVSFTVHDGVQDSNTVTKTVTVTAVEQTPVVSISGVDSGFIVGQGPISVDTGLTVTDRDDATLASATVSITSGFESSADVLAFSNTHATTFGNIAASYDAATGVLTLTSAGATATTAQWQAALRAITYNNTATAPDSTDRTIRFVVNDGNATSAPATKSVTVTGSLSTDVAVEDAAAPFKASAQTVALSAAVTSDGDTVDAGTVTFTIKSGATTVGAPVTSGTVNDGAATANYTIPANTAPGTYTIHAVYNGAAPFESSTTTAVLAIGEAPTTIVASAPSTPVTFGSAAQTVQLSATVTSTAGAVAGGTVTFTLKNQDGSTVGSPVTSAVVNGAATGSYTLPAGTAAGSYTIEAKYNSAGSFAGSSDSAGSFTVNPAATTITASGSFGLKARILEDIQLPYYPSIGRVFADAAGSLFALTKDDGDDSRPRWSFRRLGTDGTLSAPIAELNGHPKFAALDPHGNLRVGLASIATNPFDGLLLKVGKDGSRSSISIGTSIDPLPDSSSAADSSGNLYLNSGSGSDFWITSVAANGAIAPFASLDGFPVTITVDGSGVVYASTFKIRGYLEGGAWSASIFKITQDGIVSTLVDASSSKAMNVLTFDRFGNLLGIGSTVLYHIEEGACHPLLETGYISSGMAVDSSGVLTFATATPGINQKVTRVAITGGATLSATVASTAGTVNEGTVTFTLLDENNNPVGTSVTSEKVVDGKATAIYPIPGGTEVYTYTIKATYNAGGSFATSTESSQTLSPSLMQYLKIFFGQFGNSGIASTASSDAGRPFRAAAAASSLAATIEPGGFAGKLVGYIADIGAGFAVDIAIEDGRFTGQTQALTSSTGAGQTLTFSGTVADGILSGSVAELSLAFSAQVDPDAGSSAAHAGLYRAFSPDAGGATTYSIVGTQGQVFVLAVTPDGVDVGSGTVADNGVYTATTSQGGSITGMVNAEEGTTTVTLTRANGAKLTLSGLSAAVPEVHQFANLSTLSVVGGGQSITQGFVVSGEKTILARAVGPGLAPFGVSGAQAAPTLTLFDGAGQVVLSNSGWEGDANLADAFSQVGAFALEPASRDAALTARLSAGAYTLHVSGGATAGPALAELYAFNSAISDFAGSMINMSSLGRVEGSSRLVVGGFVIVGNSPKRVLIRGVGPSLAQFGVSGPLATPQLSVYDGTPALIAQNQTWGAPIALEGGPAPADGSAIAAAAAGAGAFPLDAGSADSSLLVTLVPGSYTVHLSGANGASGTGLIEVYELR